MKFRYRLMAGFLVVMLLPIVLIFLLGLILYNSQRNSFDTAYGAIMQSEDMSASAAADLCDNTAKMVLFTIQTSPEWFKSSNIYDLVNYNKTLV
ncbi:MAG: hypothetical protein J6T47_01585, partial [Lachnospiraceae bacterium]|nr:hypothetical protein [Lachnospiraceae bacterium]